MIIQPRTLICLIALMTINAIAFAKGDTSMISSKVLSIDNEPINYATVFVKGTSFFVLRMKKAFTIFEYLKVIIQCFFLL